MKQLVAECFFFSIGNVMQLLGCRSPRWPTAADIQRGYVFGCHHMPMCEEKQTSLCATAGCAHATPTIVMLESIDQRVSEEMYRSFCIACGGDPHVAQIVDAVRANAPVGVIVQTLRLAPPHTHIHTHIYIHIAHHIPDAYNRQALPASTVLGCEHQKINAGNPTGKRKTPEPCNCASLFNTQKHWVALVFKDKKCTIRDSLNPSSDSTTIKDCQDLATYIIARAHPELAPDKNDDSPPKYCHGHRFLWAPSHRNNPINDAADTAANKGAALSKAGKGLGAEAKEWKIQHGIFAPRPNRSSVQQHLY